MITGQWTGNSVGSLEQGSMNLEEFLSKGNFQSAMDDYKSSMEDLKYISDLSGITGGLSAADQSFIDTIRQNATQNLLSTVNESTVELANTEISSLVDRGVLQGGVGKEVLSKVYEKAGETVMRGTRDIETSLASASLDIMQKNKDRSLSATTSQVGLSEDWNKSLLNSLTSMENNRAQNALTQSLAGQEMSAYKQANWMSLIGNLGSTYLMGKAMGGGGLPFSSASALTGAAGTGAGAGASAGAGWAGAESLATGAGMDLSLPSAAGAGGGGMLGMSGSPATGMALTGSMAPLAAAGGVAALPFVLRGLSGALSPTIRSTLGSKKTSPSGAEYVSAYLGGNTSVPGYGSSDFGHLNEGQLRNNIASWLTDWPYNYGVKIDKNNPLVDMVINKEVKYSDLGRLTSQYGGFEDPTAH